MTGVMQKIINFASTTEQQEPLGYADAESRCVWDAHSVVVFLGADLKAKGPLSCPTRRFPKFDR